MDDPRDQLIRSAARRLTGFQRRAFLAEVAQALCDGNPRRAEERFGWRRTTVLTGLREAQTGIRCVENFVARKRPRSEERNPQLAADIRDLVEPQTQADPELKSSRRYTNLSAAEVRQALLDKGYLDNQVPKERTLRNILNRLGYRLRRIQKGKPLKKTEHTDAIFANVQAARAEAKADPGTLEISMDSKAKVNVGEYSRGGKNPDGDERLGP